MKFEKIVKDIKNLKIQSAENIAKNAVLALKLYSQTIHAITKTSFIEELERAKQILFKTRPTEPCMRNSLNFIIHALDGKDLEDLKQRFNLRVNQALTHIEYAQNIIADIGAKKIKNGSIIFTHCHSSFVTSILKKAKQRGKKFTVHNTETRPRFQGRITASELSKAGIPVIHYVDSAARLALKKADMMLIGCDAIDSEGKVYNKIGSEMFAEIADKFDIPVYVAADSWKFDPKTIFGFNEEIEQRNPDEIWKNPPKNVKISNYAFEKIDPGLITAIISEIGIFTPPMFLEELKTNYKGLFT
ncbi:MAG: S-methyl-5-thioribose-1-phosphate isomerase [Nanoarchaeota archaeon]|nr:S-methyl-5-thioribose-1-phosphate isomerase [Nanoarchaeota archaeon]